MDKQDYFEGLMRSLSAEQVADIMMHHINKDAEYVIYHVTVTNTGSLIVLEFTDDYNLEQEGRPYDIVISLSDTVTLLERYHI